MRTLYEDECVAEDTQTPSVHSSVCVYGLCKRLRLRTFTVSELPLDDDGEGHQRLRLAISGADRVLCAHGAFTPELTPAACPALKRGLKWIERALCSLFPSPLLPG